MMRRVLSLMLMTFSFAWSQQIAAIPCCQTECEVDCKGFEVFADYLNWNVAQDQMAYAARIPNLSSFISSSSGPSPTNIDFDVIEPSFKHHSGFRVGVDYDMPCSNWDFQIAWTRLHETNKSHVSEPGGIIPPLLTLISFISSSSGPSVVSSSSDPLPNTAKSHWHFEFDTIDLQLGNSCAVLCDVIMRPYVGARIATIKQKQNVGYFGETDHGIPIQPSLSRKNDFWGVGPTVGIDASLKFCSHWSLFGGFSGSLLYGKFHVKSITNLGEGFDGSSSGPKSITLKNKKRHHLRPNMDAYFGVGWDYCFCEKFQLQLGVAYEMQYWWNQWQVPGDLVGALVTSGIANQGDLMMHGLTARVGVSF